MATQNTPTMGANDQAGAVYDARVLGAPKMMVFGLQHMFAMFGATILVPVLTGIMIARRWPAMVVLFLAALAALIVLGRKPHQPEELFVNRVKAAKEAAENTEEQTT